jgi:hypothetical protein
MSRIVEIPPWVIDFAEWWTSDSNTKDKMVEGERGTGADVASGWSLGGSINYLQSWKDFDAAIDQNKPFFLKGIINGIFYGGLIPNKKGQMIEIRGLAEGTQKDLFNRLKIFDFREHWIPIPAVRWKYWKGMYDGFFEQITGTVAFIQMIRDGSLFTMINDLINSIAESPEKAETTGQYMGVGMIKNISTLNYATELDTFSYEFGKLSGAAFFELLMFLATAGIGTIAKTGLKSIELSADVLANARRIANTIIGKMDNLVDDFIPNPSLVPSLNGPPRIPTPQNVFSEITESGTRAVNQTMKATTGTRSGGAKQAPKLSKNPSTTPSKALDTATGLAVGAEIGSAPIRREVRQIINRAAKSVNEDSMVGLAKLRKVGSPKQLINPDRIPNAPRFGPLLRHVQNKGYDGVPHLRQISQAFQLASADDLALAMIGRLFNSKLGLKEIRKRSKQILTLARNGRFGEAANYSNGVLTEKQIKIVLNLADIESIRFVNVAVLEGGKIRTHIGGFFHNKKMKRELMPNFNENPRWKDLRGELKQIENILGIPNRDWQALHLWGNIFGHEAGGGMGLGRNWANTMVQAGIFTRSKKGTKLKAFGPEMTSHNVGLENFPRDIARNLEKKAKKIGAEKPVIGIDAFSTTWGDDLLSEKLFTIAQKNEMKIQPQDFIHEVEYNIRVYDNPTGSGMLENPEMGIRLRLTMQAPPGGDKVQVEAFKLNSPLSPGASMPLDLNDILEN